MAQVVERLLSKREAKSPVQTPVPPKTHTQKKKERKKDF
jgi:hypothetical protein